MTVEQRMPHTKVAGSLASCSLLFLVASDQGDMNSDVEPAVSFE
ncbi:hypothetical protein QA640_44530 (plasmid) [Bradyrhizobium sp. CB82]|nr:hypothetical protein [Bradyrhizobium sp. CB82]WFU45878.1 hypothetical protein QA640_44530 [Bradyrhizobium sp. CB82]